jgi:(1->4)-alpha-D-glucan 1-alpha-D-glucosylmutase
MRATYRLMMGPGFGFREVRELVPYLRDLGVSHLYLPPSFQARAGSAHGYDVVDPTRISDELGGEQEFRALCADARAAGLGVILDIVPNHMATDEANRYWTEQRAKFFDLDAETGRHRRFFDIDHLAGVRQEDPEVFAETHRLALALVREGLVDGLRIDHPDGLADPAGYLERLAEAGVQRIWVEKILDPGEKLPDWPVSGTVGYEFLNDVTALFVDPASEAALDEIWAQFGSPPFGEVALEAKLEQARGPFAQDVDWLKRIHDPGHDLFEALSSLPVYRTYIRGGEVSEPDREVLEEAGLQWLPGCPEEFITRFQQTSPPVMAKGVEDTAFYRYGRFVALNDVGGDPSRFAIGVEDFHEANRERQARFPENLLITQTHDTKRSGDARARLTALTAMPGAWRSFVESQGELSGEQYFLLQNIVAAWPIGGERLDGYVEKAMREAKTRTNWIEPDVEFESEMKAWARSVDPSDFVRELAPVGERHALGQLLLKLTVPGVPDIYQGDELESLSLVDPDNRRPVDWAQRRRALSDPPPKLDLIRSVLAAGVAGDYGPVDAPDGVVAFRRGSQFHVEVAVREGIEVTGPDGWQPVWTGDGMGVWRAA